MDFHSLTRKDLQSLCKLNKIPANKTNVAMADALQSLDLVEGIEKFMNVSQSETVELEESKENVEVSSPKVPATRCRTTTRQKVKTTESEILQPTGIRATRRTAKKLDGGANESKKDVLETPALSSTRRKALATSSSCRNVNSQLNDCELEEKVDQKSTTAVVTKSRGKVAAPSTTVKKESTVQKTCGTRRSTRQTEKKSGEPRARKESEKAVEINSMLDEMNVASDEVLTVEDPESTLNAGLLNEEVEDICNAFEEIEVVEAVDISEEKEDSGEVDKLFPKTDEILNQHDEGDLEVELNNLKPETDGILNPCESGDLEEGKLESEVKVLEEHPGIILDDNSHTESGVAGVDCIEVDVIPGNTENLNGPPELEEEAVSEMNNGVAGGDCIEVDVIPDNTENSNVPLELEEESISEMNNGSSTMDSDMIPDNIENSIESLNSENENNDCSHVDESTTDMNGVSENSNVPLELEEEANSEMNNGSSTMDGDMILDNIEDSIESLNSENENNDCSPLDESTNDMNEVSEIKVDEISVVIPAIDSLSPIIEEVENFQPDVFSEYSDALEGSSIEEKKQSSDSRMKKESENSVKIDLMMDELNVTSEEDLQLDVPENNMDAGNPDAKMEDVCEYGDLESDEISNPCKYGDLEEEDKFCVVSEMNHVPVSNGSSAMVNDMILDAKMEDVCEYGDLESDEISNPCKYGDLEEEDKFCVVSEMNHVPVSNGSSAMVNDMILDATETPKDTLNSDNVNNFNPYEENTIDNKEGSEDKVDETLDVISSIDLFKPDVSTENSSVEETNQRSQNQSSILIDVSGVPTPMKKMSSYVSNDKENNGIAFGNKIKKEKNMSLQDLSLRKLRKKLQALCGNQLVGGETKN